MKAALYQLSIVLVLFGQTVFAQGPDYSITGKVVDENTQQPIEFATIMVANKETKEAITGTTSDVDGNFSVKVDRLDIYLEISFIGYQAKTIDPVEFVNAKAEIGTVSLADFSQTLDEVTVRAEKSQTEFKLDKRVFNVGKDLSSTGASALEILNNVPSVNVNIEGEISLRGSTGVQILINGKPSVIANEQGSALGTLTADMIDKIEVITNPSAKYDAEGTSGIINIVIKKEERKGLNGSLSVNTGIPDNHSMGLSINRRTEKFNLFSQFGVGYRELPTVTENINQDLIRNTTILSNGKEFRNETFYNVVLGTDYIINDNNIITLSGNFAYEVEDQPSETNFQSIDESGALVSQWNRTETTEATNPKWQYELQYKRDFKDNKDHDLLFSAIGSFFGKDQSSEFINNTIFGTEVDEFQETRTNFKEARNTIKLDYTRPLSGGQTLETGAQYFFNDVSNDFAVSNLVNGDLIDDPNLTNVFDYHQKVLGIYGTWAYENEKWGLKLGLRMEHTDLNTLLVNTGETNNQNFANLFPSFHTSYKLTKAFSVQAGYSRRIFRPRLWDLNPFFNIRNNFSIRTGNPNLLPEFTDSYEITSILLVGELSLNFGIYHRYTTDVIERISTFENNVNTFSPFNIGTNQSTGIEFNAKYSPSRALSFNGDFNFNYFNREGSFEETTFDFNADQWSGKLRSKLKISKALEFEITGQYQSRVQTVQSIISDNLFADMGLRLKLMKGKGSLNFSMRDIFASRIRESETNQAEFYLYNFRQRGRFTTLGFSYGFGKGEAMEYSGQKRRY